MTALTAAGPEATAGSEDEHDEVRPPLDAVLLTPGVVEAVRALVEIMDRGGLTKLDLVHGDLAVRLRSGGARAAAGAATVDPELGSLPVRAADGSLPVAVPAPAVEPGDYVVTSPMVGTYYASPSPGAAPFVEVGDPVAAGQTVGIVEAMKIMNEIPAELGGVVVAILVENGQPVEYGSPLMRLDTRGGRGGRGAAGAPSVGIGGPA